MATLAITALKPDYSRRRRVRRNSIVASGNYTVGGIPIDLTAILNPNFYGDVFMGTVPALEDMILEKVPAGYSAEIVAGAGTTLATAFNLKLYTAPGTEMTAIALPAGITGDNFLLFINQQAWS